ncbi:hypothetical protein D1872_131670 [compost metagenome]
MQKDYTEYPNAREFLKTEYNLKRRRPWFKTPINLGKLDLIKKGLKEDLTLAQLGTIQSDIKSEMEQHKSITSLMPMIAIIITILVSTLSNNIALNNRIDDQLSNLTIKLKDIQMENFAHQDKINTFGRYMLQKINDMTHSYFMGHIYSWILYVLAFCMIFLFAYHYAATRFLSSLDNIVAQSYEEKRAEEKENKDRLDKQEQSEKALKEKELEDARAIFERKKIRRPENLKK